MKNKKGALTQKQLITIVILIVSFVIILASFWMFGLKLRIDTEACRNSVVMRGIPFGNYFISLKCKTQDVCLSMGAGCEEPVDETIPVETKKELMKEISDLFVDCWWMMGEGKADYGSTGDCAICNKIFFDVDGELTYNELYNYMVDNRISDNSMSYAFYLYKFNTVKSIEEKTEKKGTIDFNEGYAVVTKIEGGKDQILDLVKFSSKDLGKEGFGCSKFVTEV